mgnify:FL=1
MGDLASLITSPAWLEWFQRLSDYYDAVPKFIDPKSPFFGQSAPATPPEGLLAYADGTNWNPLGTGIAGVYIYEGGAWKFTGAILPASAVSSETAFGVLAAVGTSRLYARADHTHGTPTDPIPAHVAAADPHPGYLTPAEGDAAYAPIGKGVTNGDSHDHVGGDGAQIDHAGLSNLTSGDPHTQYQQESEKNAASGYAGLNASSRTTKGVDTTDDLIVDLAAKGLVLKDTQGTPHYWRGTISTVGVLTFADLGTSKP